MSLESLLITPVQRIPRYNLLLQVLPTLPRSWHDHALCLIASIKKKKDLIKHTEPSHPDYENLCKALNLMKNVSEHINERCFSLAC